MLSGEALRLGVVDVDVGLLDRSQEMAAGDLLSCGGGVADLGKGSRRRAWPRRDLDLDTFMLAAERGVEHEELTPNSRKSGNCAHV